MKRTVFFTILLSVICIVSLGCVFFSPKSATENSHEISFDFTFDDFTIFDYTLGVGDRMSAIMTSNGIRLSEGAVNSKDYYVEEDDRHHTKMLMCPVVSEDNKRWKSAYVVTTSPRDGRIGMIIDKTQKEYETYYKGPIQIGDSFEQVYKYLSIDEIKKHGIMERKGKRVYFTCESNLGTFTMKEVPYTGLNFFNNYKKTEEYLKEGNHIQYSFRFDLYYMDIVVDETLTVSEISITYDPNHVLDGVDLIF